LLGLQHSSIERNKIVTYEMHACCTAMQVQMGLAWYVLYELVKRNQQKT